MIDNPEESEGKELMVIKSFSINESLWTKASQKAKENAQSLSAVIRLLIEKWLKGEIDLTKGDE